MLRYAHNGKPELLDDLVKLTGNDLYYFLLSQTDPTLAGDLSQSTWVRVIEKRSFYQPHGSFKSWLFTLGRNLMIDEFRRNNRWQTIELEGDELTTANLTDSIIGENELARFDYILENLSFLQKEAFILQKEGFSLSEIAIITGENAQTIKSRLRYARNAFKPLLQDSQLSNKQEETR